MRKTKHIIMSWVLPLLMVGSLLGCGDGLTEPEVDLADGDLTGGEPIASIEVTPSFRLTGIEGFPARLHLERLQLGIGEVRLEPLDLDGDVVYISKTPEVLDFHLDEGVLEIDSRTIALPHTGRYLVSLRLEPVPLDSNIENEEAEDDVGGGEDDSEENSSFALSGAVATTHSTTDGTDFTRPSVPRSGKPTPLPWKPQGGGDVGTVVFMWVPFTYKSTRIAYFDLGVVEITQGNARLVINLDLSGWVYDAVTPLLSEVVHEGEGDHDRNNDDPNSRFEIDLSNELDRLGQGMENAMGDSSVGVDY